MTFASQPGTHPAKLVPQWITDAAARPDEFRPCRREPVAREVFDEVLPEQHACTRAEVHLTSLVLLPDHRLSIALAPVERRIQDHDHAAMPRYPRCFVKHFREIACVVQGGIEY